MKKSYVTKDSGRREKHKSGAVRDIRGGKGRFDLASPFAERRRADVYERGAIKYDPRNWEKGMPLSRYLDSAKRHINQYQQGLRDEDHVAQASWNLDAIMHTEEMIKRGLLLEDLDDLPKYPKRKPKAI